MGGAGSNRWKGHEKAALVEETVCIDLVALRRAGLFDRPGLSCSNVERQRGHDQLSAQFDARPVAADHGRARHILGDAGAFHFIPHQEKAKQTWRGE